MAVNSFGNIDYTVPGSGMTLISTTTLTGASVTISSIPQTYNYLYLIIRNFLPASDGANLSMRFNGDSNTNRHVENTSAGAPGAITFSQTSVRACTNGDNAVSNNLSIITIPDYTNTVTWKHADIYGVSVDATTNTSYRPLWIKADYNQTTAITSLNFFCNTGNITSGTAYLYGVK